MTMRYVKIDPRVHDNLDESDLSIDFGGDYGHMLRLDNGMSYDERETVNVFQDDFIKLHAILGELIQVLGLKEDE